MDSIFQAVSDIGFPIAICAYLLVRIEAKLEKLSGSISELARVVAATKK